MVTDDKIVNNSNFGYYNKERFYGWVLYQKYLYLHFYNLILI